MSALTAFIVLAALVALFLVLRGMKRDADRRLVALLAADAAEAERQGRIEAGFAAGWHGGSRP